MKIGRWLESRWNHAGTDPETKDLLFLDASGFATSEFYEAGFYDSEGEANALLRRFQPKDGYSPVPLIRLLRYIGEFKNREEGSPS